MSLQATIEAMIASGCSAEQLGAVVRVYTAKDEERAAARRAAAAERKRQQRTRDNVTNVTRDIEVQAVTSRDEAGHGVTERDTVPPKKETPPTPPKEKTTPSVVSESASARTDADEFYAAYPKRVNPVDAKGKFVRLVRSGVDPQRIIEAAKLYAAACRAAGTEKQFIPAPAVWLNKGGYASEDLPTAPARAGPAPPYLNGHANPEKSVHAAAQRLCEDVASGAISFGPPPEPYVLALRREREREAPVGLLPKG